MDKCEYCNADRPAVGVLRVCCEEGAAADYQPMTPDKVEAALGVLAKCEPFAGWDKDRQAFREALSVLTEALAERERDAARYRWLRDEANLVHADAPDAPMVFVAPNDGGKIDWFMSRTGPSLDTALDAAMKGTP